MHAGLFVSCMSTVSEGAIAGAVHDLCWNGQVAPVRSNLSSLGMVSSVFVGFRGDSGCL